MSFQLTNVTFAYSRQKTKKSTRNGSSAVKIQGLSGLLPDGHRIAIFGRSGLGKTTLLNLLALIWEPPLSYRLFRSPWVVEGSNLDITYRSPRTSETVNYRDGIALRGWSRLRREEFGLVPQVSHFLSGFTCRQNLTLSLTLRGKQPALLQRLLAREGLVGEEIRKELGSYPKDVSTGQGQRFSVYRAILHDPAVLFADEPVSNLDDRNKLEMLRLFSRWRRGDLSAELVGTSKESGPSQRSLILICHEPETGWAIADTFLFLYPAKVNAAGETVDLHPARGEVVTRAQFCSHYKIDSWFPEPDEGEPPTSATSEQRRLAARHGADAIRLHLDAGVPFAEKATGTGA